MKGGSRTARRTPRISGTLILGAARRRGPRPASGPKARLTTRDLLPRRLCAHRCPLKHLKATVRVGEARRPASDVSERPARQRDAFTLLNACALVARNGIASARISMNTIMRMQQIYDIARARKRMCTCIRSIANGMPSSRSRGHS